MAAQTVVVASDLDGYRNVATDGVDALLPPPGDVDALASALMDALSDQALRSHLIEGGERRANEFAMERLAERYLAIYERIA
jgi:phosphatidylinositol alpha-mannosyltransferase